MRSAIAILFALGCATAFAQQIEPAKASTAPASADEAKSAPEQAKRKPIKRRAVQATIATMPRTTPLGSETYRPVLTPPPAGPALPGPQAPQTLNCGPGGCLDAGGVRVNNGVGNATVGPQGQLCNRAGSAVQCF